MANPTLPPTGPGGDTTVKIAAKTVAGGANLQQIELATGVEGGALTPISVTNPLPTAAEQVHLNAGGSVAASQTAVTLIAANTAGRERFISNRDSTNTVFIGPAGVTTSNGIPLGPLQSMWMTANNLLQVVCATGQTASVYVAETIAV